MCDEWGGVWGGLLLGPGAEGLRDRASTSRQHRPVVCVMSVCVMDVGTWREGALGECTRTGRRRAAREDRPVSVCVCV